MEKIPTGSQREKIISEVRSGLFNQNLDVSVSAVASFPKKDEDGVAVAMPGRLLAALYEAHDELQQERCQEDESGLAAEEGQAR
jgi:hypothetical protein